MAEQTIIVMSDSHGERDIVVDIKKRYQGKVDAIFHNGDSELESSDSVWEGIHVVRGNCDYDSGYPERLVVKLGDVIIAQTHGHLFGINFTWDKLLPHVNAHIDRYQSRFYFTATWPNP